MNNGSDLSWPSPQLEAGLYRALVTAEGRHEAAKFVWKCRGDLSALNAELTRLLDAVGSQGAAEGPMRPGASPRIYQDAYISGLKDAIEIVIKLVPSGEKT